MQDTFFECEHLGKRYGDKDALKDVSLSLRRNEIYGLIGQNGAGKTTLMRVIAGLSAPDGGSFTLLGERGAAAQRNARKKFGFLLEAPALLADLTAQENFTVRQMLYGVPDGGKADAQLAAFGLSATQKVRGFSLGMRQRLGIALTLAGDPEVLILDEPTNGLDPVGVCETRTQLQRLCREQGLSILISSHNLAELYQTATRFVFIHQGRVLRQASHAELENSCEGYFILESDNRGALAAFCQNTLQTERWKAAGEKTVLLYWPKHEEARVARALFENQICIRKFSFEEPSLEQYFLRLIGGIPV